MIWNIIDNRKRPYRWKSVFAVIEATWHDNSCLDSDDAPQLYDEAEVVYDKRASVTVAEAVQWAESHGSPVTLYLYDDAASNARDWR